MKMLLFLILILLILVLATLLFAVGFFVGFAIESSKQKHKKAEQGKKEPDNAQKVREEKAKREWQRFLNYDGSSNTDERNLK